jgi:hypothetical protein
MRRFKLFLDFDREEHWLEDCAKAGFLLDSVRFGYHFHEAEPREANIRIDHRTFKRKSDYSDYLALFEDCGWTHLAGTYQNGNQYFLKAGQEGDTELFSDVSSRAARYRRLSRFWLTIGIPYLPMILALNASGAIDLGAFLHPRSLYLTPGLWEREGFAFLSAFLFETPFVLWRSALILFLPLAMLAYLFFAWKAHRHYREEESLPNIDD